MAAFLIFKFLIFAALLCFVSYFFVYKIILKLLERRKIKNTGETAQAKIVDYKIRKDTQGSVLYYPVLQYTTKDNQSFTVQSKKERFKKYEVGKELTIYYLPQDPSEFFIAGLFPYIKLTSLLIGILGACLLLLEMVRMLRKL